MEQDKKKLPTGCSVAVWSFAIFFIASIAKWETIAMFALALSVLLVFSSLLKEIMERNEKKSNEASLRDSIISKDETSMEENISEEEASLSLELSDENKDETVCEFYENHVDLKKILITKEQFEATYNHLKETCVFILDICRESEFQDFVEGIKSSDSEHTDTSQELYSGLQLFIVKDILRSYERLGHRYYTNEIDGKKVCFIEFGKPEGQILYSIIGQLIKFSSDDRLQWENFVMEIAGTDRYAKKIRRITKQALGTFANADVHASASNGLDDFAFCIILHNYSEKYEKLYRLKMLRMATLIAKADDIVTTEESKWLDSIMEGGTTPEDAEEGASQQDMPKQEDIELESLIGLHSVKAEITTLRNFVTMKQKREQAGMKSPNISYHCVFTGNPGTGKTTVARILANIYKDLGILKSGHLVETDRSGLVAEYVGQTAVKTNKIIDKALDGILFIDEAYTLANGTQNDYGAEAISTLLKRMEDDRKRLVVILAGYTKEMELFINSNPGLRSRFSRYIEFPDYTAEELYEIFCLQAKKNEFELSKEASEKLMLKLTDAVAHKEKDFGNARFVRNLFEKSIEAQANRLASKTELTKQDLILITGNDIP